MVDREITGVIHCDERAALFDEPLEARGAFRTETSSVLPGHRSHQVAVEDRPRILVGQDDRVESRKITATDVGVGEGLELELVVFEDPPRPPLVHVGDPALVEPDPWSGDSRRIGVEVSCAYEMHSGLPRDRFQ